MKLFVLNKDDFDFDTTHQSVQKMIHSTAYHILLKDLALKKEPTKKIEVKIDGFEEYTFEFVSNSDDVYFYNYIL
jgi:septum formation inhibitor MinC